MADRDTDEWHLNLVFRPLWEQSWRRARIESAITAPSHSQAIILFKAVYLPSDRVFLLDTPFSERPNIAPSPSLFTERLSLSLKGYSINDPGHINAWWLIEEAAAASTGGGPTSFQLPQDQLRVECMAELLEQYGQNTSLGLSEAAAMHGTSILWEAFRQQLFSEQLAEEAAGVPLLIANAEDATLASPTWKSSKSYSMSAPRSAFEQVVD